MAVLTAAERERCRYHLGYMNVQPAAAMLFGMPRPIQTAFLVESAMTNLIAETVPRIQQILQTLDGIECQMVGSLKQLSVDALGPMKMAGTMDPKARLVTERLEEEYKRWVRRLADNLGVPLYAFSQRNRPSGGGSVPVRR